MEQLEINIVKDIAALTAIPEKAINKIFDKVIYCINEAVAEARLAGQSFINLNFGFGDLLIQLTTEGIKYRFIPAKKLEESVKDTFINKQNLLEVTLDASLVAKVTNLYKDLL